MRRILPTRETSSAEDAGPLDGSYRLAVLLMLTGFLLVPTLKLVGVAGESVIFAGYMGVTTVLVSLFLVMGRISGRDSARAFAQGFTALFFGEFVGVMAGGAAGAAFGGVASTPSVAVAGVAVIVASQFLFTDRDLKACLMSSMRPTCSRRRARASRVTPRCRSVSRRFCLSRCAGERASASRRSSTFPSTRSTRTYVAFTRNATCAAVRISSIWGSASSVSCAVDDVGFSRTFRPRCEACVFLFSAFFVCSLIGCSGRRVVRDGARRGEECFHAGSHAVFRWVFTRKPGSGGLGAFCSFATGRVSSMNSSYRAVYVHDEQPHGAARRDHGLEALKRPCRVEVHSDSVRRERVQPALGRGWLKRGWRNADKQPVKNVDLWKKAPCREGASRGDVSLGEGTCWASENERCDQLATAAADAPDRQVDEGSRGVAFRAQGRCCARLPPPSFRGVSASRCNNRA